MNNNRNSSSFPLALVAILLAGRCSYPAEADALAISANIQARHIPSDAVTILDPIYASAASNQAIGYTRCGDSAIWTGHYLAAEAFRYRVTQAADAFSNVKKAIAGIQALTDVTGNGLLARCMILANSPFAAGIQSEEAHNGIYISPPWVWVGNTSRDQYAGVVFGLGIAYDLVDDPAIKNSISTLVTRVIDYPRTHNWTIPEPDGSNNLGFIPRPDFIETFLAVGRHINPSHFAGSFLEERTLLLVPIATPLRVETRSDDSYFKFNLDYINFYNLVRLDANPGNTDSRVAFSILRNHTVMHLNPFFNMIDRGLNGPNAARDNETLALLDEWLKRPSRRDNFVDLHGAVPVCGDQACQPIPVALRVPTDFLWQRSPFQLAGGGSGTVETAGIDYILPYWMSRYYALGSTFTVQSAAASSAAVAADSLGSIFGQSLAGKTEQAGALPLPTGLGGLSLTVRDAAGTERLAQLIYVSPTQINFVVPKGTGAGMATFTIANGTTLPAATGNVQSVAPTLFSMSGNGMGVAAATAIRTPVATPQVQSPVPVFQCSSPGNCSTAPIDLGVDAPVYLSLYGTGIRNRSSLSNVNVAINSINVPVLYAGPQTDYVGLDQVNVLLVRTLRGVGESNVVITVEGRSSNAVRVKLR